MCISADETSLEVVLAGRSGETAHSSAGLTPPSHVQSSTLANLLPSYLWGSWKLLKAVSSRPPWSLFDYSYPPGEGVVAEWEFQHSQSSGCRLCFALRNTRLSLRGKRWAGFPLRHATDADADTSLFLYRQNGWVTFCHLMHVCVDFCCIFNYQLYPK